MLYNIEELGFVWFRYEGCFKGFPVIKYTYVAYFKVTKWFALPCMFRLFVRFTEAYSESCQRSKIKSSHQRCSVKKGFLRNFAKFPGKQLCKSLFFIKVAGLRPATLLKKRLWRKCLPVNFGIFICFWFKLCKIFVKSSKSSV